MSYCAYCGAQMEAGAAACPACGLPSAGPPPPGGSYAASSKKRNWPLLVVLGAVGCLGLITVGGCVAAIVIPNFLDALHKARTKRTIVDMRTTSTAILAYWDDHDGPPPADSMGELASYLVPDYLSEVPTTDGWKHPLGYTCWREFNTPSEPCDNFALVSPGRDGLLQHPDPRDYPPDLYPPGAYDSDIVWVGGQMVYGPDWRKGRDRPAEAVEPAP